MVELVRWFMYNISGCTASSHYACLHLQRFVYWYLSDSGKGLCVRRQPTNSWKPLRST